MAGGAPHPFIGARGGRGGGWVEGARPAPLMAVGSRFTRGTGSHRWDLNGGRRWLFLGEERTVERWQRTREPAAAASWPIGRRRKMKGEACASVREREGGGLGRASREAKAQEEWGKGWPIGLVEGEAGRGEEGEAG
jgi:hypothetical protein